MLKGIFERVKSGWNNLFFSKDSKANRKSSIILGVVLLGIIMAEAFYLGDIGNKEELAMKKDILKQKKNGLIIGSPQKESLEKISQEIQGTVDSGFEFSYGTGKYLVTKNVSATISTEQCHSAKKSLKMSWENGAQRSVRLDNYLSVQKGKAYKIGLWATSVTNNPMQLSLGDKETSYIIADMNILSNAENEFRYYEYNFYASDEASNLIFIPLSKEPGSIFIDDIKLLPLNKTTELALIKKTLLGSNSKRIIGEKQFLHDRIAKDLSSPHTFLGQVFTASASDLAGVSFFLRKYGDGGVGDYVMELREFDTISQTLIPKRLAVKHFLASDILSEVKFFSLPAKLESGKEYWIGFNNSNVSADENNYLAIGQAERNTAYLGGNGFLQQGENKIFTEERDLSFGIYYNKPNQSEIGPIAYGLSWYDLGAGKSRLEYQLDGEKGNNILDVYAKKDILVDKWGNILLENKDSYLVYKISAKQRIAELLVANLAFHNNIHLALSTDGSNWTEIFSTNTGQNWQNSGKIQIDFQKDTKAIFLKLRKNGTENSVFIRGQFIFNLMD
jgi:hypothetical protein